MPTIDLAGPPASAAAAEPASPLTGVPRRLTVTLPELRLVAELIGGAPLPFAEPAQPPGGALADRLGSGLTTAATASHDAALARLHPPRESLARRGLLDGDRPDPGLAGAVGLLASPRTAVDLDVAAAGVHVRSWQRRGDDAVAALSTADGVVFELAWFGAERWHDELSRVALLPAEIERTPSTVPIGLEVPLALADAVGEAIRTGRRDLVGVLVGQSEEPATDASGRPLPPGVAARQLSALADEARGRLRALVAQVEASTPEAVGVVAWTLLGDGWHALRPRRVSGRQHVRVVAVEPHELADDVATVLAEVRR